MQLELFASVEFTGICEYCGEISPNQFLLGLNHSQIGANGLCTSQYLTTAHLIYATRQGRDPSRDIARARELRLDPDKIIADTLAELPDLCLGCRHNKKPEGRDYCSSRPCQEKENHS